MIALYGELFRLRRTDESRPVVQDFSELMTRINDWHDQLHREVFADIRAGNIDQSAIASLLNLDRGVSISNLALVMPLTDYHLHAKSSEALKHLREAS